MKKMLALLFIVFVFSDAVAQDLSGKWHGMLKVGAARLRISIDLLHSDTGYSGKLTSVDQGNTTLPMQWVKVNGTDLSFRTSVGNIEYAGSLKDTLIRGIFKQGAQQLPLDFGRAAIGLTVAKRPQEPKAPFPYVIEEVSFKNEKENVTLSGTFTKPTGAGKFPVVVLISGSGAQNRDEELAGHKPFLVLSDHLTKNGIAVLRYDDRGTAKSTGNFQIATSENFATDVEAAVAYLKTRADVDLKKIGLVGHSEGGLIAPMVAARNKDVGYIVMMAGPGVKGRDVLLLQIDLLSKAEGMPDEEIKKQVKLMSGITEILTMNGDTAVVNQAFRAMLNNAYMELPDSVKKTVTAPVFAAQFSRLSTPWMKFFLGYDPAPALQKTKIPVLALNGTKDLQVWAPQNLPAVEAALKKGGNKKYTIRELPGLNHLFQEAKTGGSSEYAEIEQTLAPAALEAISSWIKKTVN
jgi:pimeloyl-ACP methyl ester carboxylesterase